MCLQSLGSARKAALHVTLGAMNVVSKNMQSRSISLCLDSHSFLRLWSCSVPHGSLRQDLTL
jgi:hypothetical protein